MTLPAPVSRTFISQRLRLHYVDWGNPDAPPLLLVHGGRDHCRSWDWTARRLRDDWHVIALDLRGHGDSEWADDGNYLAVDMVYDVAQLIHQFELAPVTIVAHSFGGNICTRYAGIFPDNVRKLVSIEGLGPSPREVAEMERTPYPQRVRDWIEEKRKAAGRQPRRYASIEDALARMKSENTYLDEEQAHHLTAYGVDRNEDGSFSWKFDPHLNVWAPVDDAGPATGEIWRAISCPTLLLYGADSWASNPERDGRAAHFGNARVIEFEQAGHWPHHDQFERFIATLRDFL
jgi:pimeloyl-ACP methyl ester carboxylesterase